MNTAEKIESTELPRDVADAMLPEIEALHEEQQDLHKIRAWLLACIGLAPVCRAAFGIETVFGMRRTMQDEIDAINSMN